MHTIQSFLIVVLCGFVWLTIILGLALAEDVTIYDKAGSSRNDSRTGRFMTGTGE